MLYSQFRNGIDYFEINKTPNITAISGCNIGCRFCKYLIIKLIGREDETWTIHKINYHNGLYFTLYLLIIRVLCHIGRKLK